MLVIFNKNKIVMDYASVLTYKTYFYRYHNITNNCFYDQDHIDLIRRFMEKNSRMRQLCRRFIVNCRKSIMKSHTAINDTDLYMNSILSEDEVQLYDNGKKYIFSKNDIKQIFVMALSESEDGWPLPKKPKNPYTNIEFTKEQIDVCMRYIDDKPLICKLFLEYQFHHSL